MSDFASRVKKARRERRSDLARTAYMQIKEAIVYAKFKPGEYLSENTLAEVLGMSRTPVREALKKLAGQNLVDIVPGRGAFVKDVSLQDLLDIFELRKVLECLAAETALANITDAEIQESEEAWLCIRDRIRRGEAVDLAEISRYDNQLHTLIVSKCRNSYLKDFMGVLNQQILRYQLLTAQALGDVEDTIRQHLEIIALLRDKDPRKFIPVLRDHIEAAEQVMVRAIMKANSSTA